MTLHDLLAGIPLRGGRFDREMEINSISWESKDITAGTLFVDVTGDGAVPAMERGAAAVVTAQTIPGGITVDDPWQALALLGNNWYCRPGRRMVLAAVAGSGDTQLGTHLLRVMLEGMNRVRVGVIAPDTAWINGVELLPGQRVPGGLCVQRLLRRMADEGCTHVLVQLDEGGLQRRETAGLHLSLAALTGPVDAKEGLSALLRQSDTVVLNLDERAWEDYGGILPARPFTYSENKTRADLVARNLRLFPSHMEFEAVTVGQIQRIHLPAPGGFGLYHGLFALACGLCLGLNLRKMAQVLRSAKGPGRRMEILPVPAAYTVVLDQADTPQALEQLLVRARAFTAGRLVCLLSGPTDGDGTLEPVLSGVAEQLSDRMTLTCQADRQQAICKALEQAQPGDVIVLAGGTEHRNASGAARAVPDEREIVSRYIQQQQRRRQGVPAGM